MYKVHERSAQGGQKEWYRGVFDLRLLLVVEAEAYFIFNIFTLKEGIFYAYS